MHQSLFPPKLPKLALTLAVFTGLLACQNNPPTAESPTLKQAVITSSSASPTTTASATPVTTIEVANGKAVVVGTILDVSGNPVNNATITLQPTLQQMQSFDKGNYEFRNLEPGSYTVVVNKDNFETQKQEFKLEAGKALPLDVKITPKGIKAMNILPVNAKRVVISSPLQLKAEIEMQNGDIDNKATWQTSDPTIATVDSSGIVSGLKEGKVTISAISQQNTAVVKQVALDVIKHTFIITGAGQLDVNSKSKLFAEPPSDNLFKNANYTWKSSDPSILKLTVNEAAPTIATMEGLKDGVVTVTATLSTKDPDSQTNINLTSQELSLTVGSGRL